MTPPSRASCQQGRCSSLSPPTKNTGWCCSPRGCSSRTARRSWHPRQCMCRSARCCSSRRCEQSSARRRAAPRRRAVQRATPGGTFVVRCRWAEHEDACGQRVDEAARPPAAPLRVAEEAPPLRRLRGAGAPCCVAARCHACRRRRSSHEGLRILRACASRRRQRAGLLPARRATRAAAAHARASPAGASRRRASRLRAHHGAHSVSGRVTSRQRTAGNSARDRAASAPHAPAPRCGRSPTRAGESQLNAPARAAARRC
jgi:hypothetical protein